MAILTIQNIVNYKHHENENQVSLKTTNETTSLQPTNKLFLAVKK